MSSPQETWRKLQRMANQAGKGGGPSPRGLAGGVGSILALGGLLVVGNNALFNVDGGHRAIKYTRIGGVSKEIYSEGMDYKSETDKPSDGN
jgi:prohibitin 2